MPKVLVLRSLLVTATVEIVVCSTIMMFPTLIVPREAKAKAKARVLPLLNAVSLVVLSPLVDIRIVALSFRRVHARKARSVLSRIGPRALQEALHGTRRTGPLLEVTAAVVAVVDCLVVVRVLHVQGGAQLAPLTVLADERS